MEKRAYDTVKLGLGCPPVEVLKYELGVIRCQASEKDKDEVDEVVSSEGRCPTAFSLLTILPVGAKLCLSPLDDACIIRLAIRSYRVVTVSKF